MTWTVLPDTLPCRTEQKEKIMAYLRDGIAKGGNVRPLYISGMPGTGGNCISTFQQFIITSIILNNLCTR